MPTSNRGETGHVGDRLRLGDVGDVGFKTSSAGGFTSDVESMLFGGGDNEGC